ncbi:S-adenosyl-L-methionine-dependent methyltransferase [Talaromyces proteolyticus]|uniref:S-adenosyl-L-methionine-dependent methyltransferase n=1 Tax=Talaromyces proteolyticus TaxID=1131652 RepID=A0AAD4KKH3_9EURO|nr:S-adenosyl-L-methionine-dependent methyltransferase [Talaromyces proteolyticus]KAH8694893.1 S-adenosyl-L-methionine-dependent methyltransferase [Talaromyces proteolyticus]
MTGRDGDSSPAIDVDEDYEGDSAWGGDDSASETTSVTSSIYRGLTENGRRYQSYRDHDYWGPSDEKQFETMEAGHFMYLVLDYHEQNRLHRAPIGEAPQHILDIGTGKGSWAIDAADTYPSATVRGVDLYPPPIGWVPPNCVLEVDDALQEWTWREPFDLIHMRLLLGAFTPEEWDKVYTQCFENLKPGGWIEQVELDVRVMSDDGSLPEDSLLAGWGPNFLGCGERSGRPLNTQTTMQETMEKAGFVDAHEKLYKCPIGAWPKNPQLKDAGAINLEHWSSGLEGWAMWLLTKHGSPKPWTSEEVRVYVAKVRSELQNPKLHIYHYTRRVWARKPLNTSSPGRN